jgi:hypothetical protein
MENNNLSPIYLRNVPPPAETFDHVSFFKFFFSFLKPECFLELGVRDGRNFVAVSEYCKKAIAVDIVAQEFNGVDVKSEIFEYHTMSTDSYFQNLDRSIMFDAVFIDADHSHEQSLKDFLNVKDNVIEDGFIFFHDTYPWDESYFDPGACNDVYKTAHYIKQNFIDEFEIVTLPFNPGVTIVKKMNRNKQLIYIN